MLNYIRTISITSLILLFSCNSTQSIENDETVLEFFSQTEAKDLQSIHDFFTSQICNYYDVDNRSQTLCYEEWMEKININLPSSEPNTEIVSISNPVDKEEQIKLFENFESNVFDEIWVSHHYTGSDSITYETIGLKSNGKFIDFIEKLGEEHESIKNYKESIESDAKLIEGKITIKTVKSVLNYPENFEVSDIRVRLVIAIHYLTRFYSKEV